jgi:hypothetical protein
MASEVANKDLLPMDVPGKHGCEVLGQIGASDHIRPVSEREIRRANGGALNAVVYAEDAQVGALFPPSRLFQDLREPLPDSSPLVRKTGDSYSNTL